MQFLFYITISSTDLRFPLPSPINNFIFHNFTFHSICSSFFFFFFAVIGPHLWHMAVLDLHHSSRQRWIPNPLRKARDQNKVLMNTCQIYFCCTTMGTHVVPNPLSHVDILESDMDLLEKCSCLHRQKLALDLSMGPWSPLERGCAYHC